MLLSPRRSASLAIAVVVATSGAVAQQSLISFHDAEIANPVIELPERIAEYDHVVAPAEFGFFESIIWGIGALTHPEEILDKAVIMYAYDSDIACSTQDQGHVVGFTELPSDLAQLVASNAERQSADSPAALLFHGPVESACALLDEYGDDDARLAAGVFELAGIDTAMGEGGSQPRTAANLESFGMLDIALVGSETVGRFEEVLAATEVTDHGETLGQAIFSIGRLDRDHPGTEIWAFCGEPRAGKFCFGKETVQ